MELYSIEEAARRLNRSYGYVKKKIDNNEIEAIRIASTYRIKKEVLDEFMKKNKQEAIDGYTIEKFAEKLKVSYGLISSLVRNGEIKAVKSGRKYIIPEAEFDRYVNSSKLVKEDDNTKIDDKKNSDSSRLSELGDVLDNIGRLNLLFKEGAITEEELLQLKKKLLEQL